MEPDHWHLRWQQGRTGFHTGEPNPWLERFYPELGLNSGDTVLLPLCGKAVDLVWLAQHKHNVLGVELSEIALQHFFEEQQLAAVRSQQPPFTQWESGPITLLEGDFFDVAPEPYLTVPRWSPCLQRCDNAMWRISPRCSVVEQPFCWSPPTIHNKRRPDLHSL